MKPYIFAWNKLLLTEAKICFGTDNNTGATAAPIMGRFFLEHPESHNNVKYIDWHSF